MEVVLLLLGIAGIALIAVPRIKRRRSAKPVAASRRRAAAAPVATWTPAASSDDDGWDDDLGWEGVSEPAPETREAWNRWRETESPLAAAPEPEPEPEPALPSVERWRTQAQEDPDWVEDDGLGWEGEDVAAPTLWKDTGEPAPQRAVASAAAPERTIKVEGDDWDAPIGRAWGVPEPDEEKTTVAEPATARRRPRIHPVVMLAVYAAGGIGLVVLASTLLLGGSSAEPSRTSAPQPKAPAATPSPEVVRSAAAAATAAEIAEKAAAAAQKARTAFQRERRQALRERAKAISEARAAAKRKARREAAARRKARQRAAAQPAPQRSTTPPPASATPPPATYNPAPRPNPAPAPKRRQPSCEFCIG